MKYRGTWDIPETDSGNYVSEELEDFSDITIENMPEIRKLLVCTVLNNYFILLAYLSFIHAIN